jgi:hypothetical protein
MEKIFRAFLIICSLSGLAYADREVFWPPDMVPHPNPPWDQPKDNNEGELA